MAARGAGTGTWPYSNGLDLKPSWLGGWLFDVLPGAVLLDGDDAVEGDAVARGGGLDGGAVGEHAADVAHVVGGELVADDDAGAVVALVAAGGQHDEVVGVVVAVVVVDVVNLEAGGDGALVGAVDEAVGEGRDLPAVAVDADADVAGGVQPFGAMGLAGDGGVGLAGAAVAAADAPDAAFVVDADKPEEDEAVEGLALVDGGAPSWRSAAQRTRSLGSCRRISSVFDGTRGLAAMRNLTVSSRWAARSQRSSMVSERVQARAAFSRAKMEDA